MTSICRKVIQRWTVALIKTKLLATVEVSMAEYVFTSHKSFGNQITFFKISLTLSTFQCAAGQDCCSKTCFRSKCVRNDEQNRVRPKPQCSGVNQKVSEVYGLCICSWPWRSNFCLLVSRSRVVFVNIFCTRDLALAMKWFFCCRVLMGVFPKRMNKNFVRFNWEFFFYFSVNLEWDENMRENLSEQEVIELLIEI